MKLFWHAAIMGSIGRVAHEQMALFDNVKLRASVGIVGPDHRIVQMIRRRCHVLFHQSDLTQYETPTLQALWEWCQTNDDDAVLYCHTKGVSKPGVVRRAWRKLMEHHVIANWQRNILRLRNCDVIGVNWVTNCWHLPVPCFTGNFWMARPDWIRRLPSPVEYRANPDPRWVPVDHPHQWARMHAEMWIGAREGARVVSLACQNAMIARIPTLTQLLRECGHYHRRRKIS